MNINTTVNDEIKDLEQILSVLPIPVEILGVTTDAGTEIELKYLIRGMQKSAGGIQMVEEHQIRISVTFGYPHLAPRCRALTRVFHPAFDEDTIQIQDFWPTSKSLIGLVLYLGRMISGQVVTVDNIFSQEAQEWYDANLTSLPFDDIILQYSDAEIQAAKTAPTAEKSSMPGHSAASTVPIEKADEIFEITEDIPQVVLPASEPAPSFSEDEDEFAAEAAEDSDSQYLKQSSPIFASFLGKSRRSSRVSERSSFSTKGTSKKPTIIVEDIPAEPRKISVFTKAVVVFGIIGTVAAAGFAVYTADTNKLRQSADLYERCLKNIKNQEFKAAETECQAAEVPLAELRILSSNGDILKQKIRAALLSEELIQGLNGNIFVNNQYVPKDEHELQKRLQEEIRTAESQFVAGSFAESAKTYRSARALAERSSKATTQRRTADLRTQELKAEFEVAFKHYKQKFQFDTLDELETARHEVQRLLSEMPSSTALRFQKRLQSAKELEVPYQLGAAMLEQFQKQQWKKVLALSERFNQLDGGKAFLQTADGQRIQNTIHQARVFQSVHAGNKAYKRAEWLEAEKSFRSALAEIRKIPSSEGDIKSAKKKIESLLLHAKVNRLWTDAERHLAKSNVQTASQSLRQALEILDHNPVMMKDFDQFKTRIRSRLRNLTASSSKLTTKAEYLRSNFSQILKEELGDETGEYTELTVDLLQRGSGTELYRLRFRKPGDRTVIHELYYEYRVDTDSWSAVFK